MENKVLIDLSKVKDEEGIYGVLCGLMKLDNFSDQGLERLIYNFLDNDKNFKAHMKEITDEVISLSGIKLPEDFKINYNKVFDLEEYRNLYKKLTTEMIEAWLNKE